MRGCLAFPCLLFGSLRCYSQACQTLLPAAASLQQPGSGSGSWPSQVEVLLDSLGGERLGGGTLLLGRGGQRLVHILSNAHLHSLWGGRGASESTVSHSTE